MIQYNPLQVLPTAEELPDSDDTPVDNELQNLVPNLLLAILAIIWSERQDWFFGVDMGIYYLPETPQNALVPDGFLSVGVDRRKSDRGRLSYVMWEENYTAPVLSVEVVSQTYGGEYDTKLDKYRSLGVLYYVVYNPDFWRRDKHAPFEAYRLINNQYVLQSSEPFWMPEIGLGIGRSQGTYKNWRREWLYWFERSSDTGFERCLSPDEWADRVEQQLEQTEQQLEQTEQQLEQTEQQLEQTEQQLEQTEQQLEQERRLRDELLEKLRRKGISLDDL